MILFPTKMLEEQEFILSLLILVFKKKITVFSLSVHITLRQSTDDSITVAINCISYCQCNLQLGFVQKFKGDIFVLQLSEKCEKIIS